MKYRTIKPKGEKEYKILITMTKKDYDLLSAYAKREWRSMSNAALILIRDALTNALAKNSTENISNHEYSMNNAIQKENKETSL